jgi:hypothetical protein
MCNVHLLPVAQVGTGEGEKTDTLPVAQVGTHADHRSLVGRRAVRNTNVIQQCAIRCLARPSPNPQISGPHHEIWILLAE